MDTLFGEGPGRAHDLLPGNSRAVQREAPVRDALGEQPGAEGWQGPGRVLVAAPIPSTPSPLLLPPSPSLSFHASSFSFPLHASKHEHECLAGSLSEERSCSCPSSSRRRRGAPIGPHGGHSRACSPGLSPLCPQGPSLLSAAFSAPRRSGERQSRHRRRPSLRPAVKRCGLQSPQRFSSQR